MEFALIITVFFFCLLLYLIYVSFFKSEQRQGDKIKRKEGFILLTFVNLSITISLAGWLETSLEEPSAMLTGVTLVFTLMTVVSFIAYIRLKQLI
jgi:Ca2+/Na+ antiporter